MVCKTAILSLCLLIEDEVDEVESGEQRRWELDVLNHTKLRVVLRVDRIGSGKDSCASVECADDTCFGNRDSLLFHGFVEDCARVIVHLVELIDAADAAV